MIKNKKNEGFAKGNNCGYSFAKKKLKADYIICINNDTLMLQKDFLEKIVEIENKDKCDVLGPDIISQNGEHQSPRRIKPLSLNEVKKSILRKSLMLLYFYWRKYLFGLKFVENLYRQSNANYKEQVAFSEKQENVVLLGACIIYCPEFVYKEEYAFSPKTFMYGEEDLLAWHCHKRNYKILFDPQIKITHLGEISTKRSIAKEVDKLIFIYKNTIQGLILLRKEMK